MFAALPVLAAGYREDWHGFYDTPRGRPEFCIGEDFIEANGERSLFLIRIARWACIPFSLIGGLFSYLWARYLYGRAAGVLSCTFWCLSPSILAHGSLITADVAAAALGLAACYTFWLWLRKPEWVQTLIAGIMLGIAELAKTTLIVFYPLWPLLWVCLRLSRRNKPQAQKWRREGALLLAQVAVSICILNLGYGFEGSCKRLREFCFVSELFSFEAEARGEDPPAAAGLEVSNCFARSWLGVIPVVLPRNYIVGIDIQRRDLEGHGRLSYLFGDLQDTGWWYYYVYALAIKVPLGTWCVAAVAVGVTAFGRGHSVAWRDEAAVLAPGLVILIFVSSQSGFSAHSRYVIPALPFICVWMSKVAGLLQVRPMTRKHLASAAIVLMALIWSVTSSLWAYPHSMSYFNELAGGPRHGGEHLLDSNVDWGQDLLYLNDWLDKHADINLDGLAYYGSYPATLAGISKTPCPPPRSEAEYEYRDTGQSEDAFGPKPGWYAVSVNYLYGRFRYCYFLSFEPVAMAGYSVYIYHITPEEATRRRKLGCRKWSSVMWKADAQTQQFGTGSPR